MIVENKTKLNGDEIKTLLVYNAKKENYRRFIFALLILVFGVVLLIVTLSQKQFNTSLLTFSLFFIVMSIIYAIMTFVSTHTLPKKLVKENKELCEFGANYSYNFKENSMKCENKVNESTVKYEYSYEKLKSAKEYISHYELRFDDSTVAYVLKSGFIDKKQEEIFRNNISINKKYQEGQRKRKRIKIKNINKDILVSKNSEK